VKKAEKVNTTQNQALRNWFSEKNNTGVKHFPFNNFRYCLTLFSKFYSSFPSRYLFAIGLSPIFSFRWNLPPILDCIPKQSDSLKIYQKARKSNQIRDSHPLSCPIPRNFYYSSNRKHFYKLQFVKVEPWRFQIWALPASLAVTKGILVSFISSAYWYA